MNHIFVVGTPLQLLAAYILGEQFFPQATNQLVLIHPQGNKLWHNSYSLQKMSTDSAVWQQVVVLEKWLQTDPVWKFPRQMQQLKEQLLVYGAIDQVFLGSDKIIQNQILVELLGCSYYARIEDGIWSYHNRDRRKLSKVWQYLRVKIFRYLGHITGDLEYNFGGVGHGKAAIADYLFKPQLLERESPFAICIAEEAIQRAMQKMTKEMAGIPEMQDDHYLLYLGSTFVERNVISSDQEREIISDLYRLAQNCGTRLLYKPHPKESAEKVKQYKYSLPNMRIIRANDPIEVIYARHQQNLKWVLSISSSGLLFANVFSHNIIPIALFKLYSIEQNQPALERMMEKAGVVIPNSLHELQSLVLGLGNDTDLEMEQ